MTGPPIRARRFRKARCWRPVINTNASAASASRHTNNSVTSVNPALHARAATHTLVQAQKRLQLMSATTQRTFNAFRREPGPPPRKDAYVCASMFTMRVEYGYECTQCDYLIS